MNSLPLRSGSITNKWSNSREQELNKLKQEVSTQTKLATKENNSSKSVAAQAYLSKNAIDENLKQPNLKSSEQKPQSDVENSSLKQETSSASKSDALVKLAEIERRLAQLESERQAVIEKLSSRDLEVRQHEEAHIRVGQELAGSPSYQTITGPDGRRYIVDGEVPIDVSTSKDPEITMQKMQKVMRAALAPAEPSPTDHQVYSIAQANYNEARALKEQLDAKINKENLEKAKILTEKRLQNQEDTAVKTQKLGKMAFEEATEDLDPKKTSFNFGKKRDKVVAVLQKLELFGKKNLSAQEVIKNHFEWASTLKLPQSYNAGANLDIAA